MTETTHVSASTREVPLAPGGEVHVLLTANNAIVRGTDRDVITVRARGGEDLDDEVEESRLRKRLLAAGCRQYAR